MFVVTDGRPSRVSEFQEMVQTCNWPVLGVTIGDGSQVDGQVYHREAEASGEELRQTLENLLTEVMF